MDTASVRFGPAGVTVEVALGSTLLEAARAAGIAIDAPCGGHGRCGSCRVKAEGALTPLSRDEGELLGGAGVAAGKRLACRARVTGPVTVTLAEPSGETRVVHAVADAAATVEPPSARGIERREGSEYLLGAVVDIGTTTVAVGLIDLENGDELGRAGMLNVQYPWGADVMSRIASAQAEGTAALQQPIARQVERLIVGLLVPLDGAIAADVREVAMVGNTTMLNALLGEDLAPLGQAPYEGAVLGPVTVPAAELGMALLPAAVCHLLPGASAFIGADVVAGVLASGLDAAERPTLYLDLGTNGELVLAVPGRPLLAASAAAGPALEGAGIERGMRAEPGAIERVWRDEAGDLTVATVGGFPPIGLCGSGVLDLLALMLDAGVLAADGRLAGEVAGPLARRVAERDGVRTFIVDEHSGVALSQHDVRQLQLAKGAVRTAIELLLQEAALAPDAVEQVLVAGGFGLHVDGAALERIGMVPLGWGSKLRFLGNAAKEGARLALVDSGTRSRAATVARSIETLPLADHPAFQSRFLGALDFPQ